MDTTAMRKSIYGSLRYERKQRGLTQTQVAEKLDTSATTIGAWEGENGSISFEKAWALADFYGIGLDQLAGRTEGTVV